MQNQQYAPLMGPGRDSEGGVMGDKSLLGQ